MTLRELMENINIEGGIKVQCWEDENNPTIYFEDQINCGIPNELKEHMDREVAYMFPYPFWCRTVCLGGICIELASED